MGHVLLIHSQSSTIICFIFLSILETHWLGFRQFSWSFLETMAVTCKDRASGETANHVVVDCSPCGSKIVDVLRDRVDGLGAQRIEEAK